MKKTELRFVFQYGDCRIEELNFEGEVVNSLGADPGTIEGYFDIWKKQPRKITTIQQLEEIVTKEFFS